jgi:hypothetical protein
MLDAARDFFAEFEFRGFGVRISFVDVGEVSVGVMGVPEPTKGRVVG